MSASGFVQVAYLVEDIEQAAQLWAADVGAGPFLLMRNIHLQEVLYRGRPAEFDHSSAYGQYGDLMVELVQQNNPGPSALRDAFPAGGCGLHHMARFAHDLDEELENYRHRGHDVAMQARAGDIRFAFVDTLQPLGHMVELYQDCEEIRAFYAAVAEAALGWDGGTATFELPGGG